MAKQDSFPEPGPYRTPKRFHDTDRAFRVHRVSGLIVESTPDRPSVGVLPNGTRLKQASDESYKDFLDRCESYIPTGSVI